MLSDPVVDPPDDPDEVCARPSAAKQVAARHAQAKSRRRRVIAQGVIQHSACHGVFRGIQGTCCGAGGQGGRVGARAGTAVTK